MITIKSANLLKALKSIKVHFSNLESFRTSKVIDTKMTIADGQLVLENGGHGFYLCQKIPIEINQTEPTDEVAAYVDAILLSQFNIPNNVDMTIDMGMKNTTIKFNKTRYSVQNLQSSSYVADNKPEMTNGNVFEVDQSIFDKIKRVCNLPTIFSKTELLPVSFLIEKGVLKVQTSDEYCGVFYKTPLEHGDTCYNFVIPYYVISKFFNEKTKEKEGDSQELSLFPIKVGIGSNFITLEKENVFVSYPLLQVNTNNVEDFIENQKTKKDLLSFTCNRASLLDSVNSVFPIIANENIKRVSMVLKENNLELHSVSQLGEAKAEMEVSDVFSGTPSPSFNLHGNSLKKFPDMLKTENISFIFWSNIITMMAEDVTFIIPLIV